MKKRLIIVDLSGFIFRAFYAIKPLHSPDGKPVNAVHGVLSMLLKLIAQHKPTNILLARDSRAPTFRKKMYPEYKANRPAPPEDLIPQFGLIEQMVQKMELANFSLEGYEADDLIGSIVTQWRNNFDEIFIASSDKDLMQFVDDKVKMLDTMKDKIYGKEGVFEKMNVWPDQIVDYLSILGDSSDNIPGMKGIGAKGASKLLAEYKTLDGCIKAKDSYTNKRIKNAFENYIDDAHLSKKLTTIVTDLDLEFKPDVTKFSLGYSEELGAFLKNLGLKSAIKKFKEIDYGSHQERVNDQALKSRIMENIPDATDVKKDFVHKLVENKKDFEKLIPSQGKLAIYVCYHDCEDGRQLIHSISITIDGKNSYHFSSVDRDDDALEILKKIVSNKELEILGYDLKNDICHVIWRDIEFMAGFFDVLLAHYDLDSTGKNDIQTLSRKYFDCELFEHVESGMDSEAKTFETTFLGERVNIIYLLSQKLKLKLEEHGLDEIFYKMDNPLIPVLAKMEHRGILLNAGFLKKLEVDFETKSLEVVGKIEKISGYPVNLRSPKQVGELLFEKLGLPIIKKNKTGASTNVEVLEELNSRGLSEVPKMILKYRELEKLLSTYVRVLPKMIDPRSGRLHTHFNQHNVVTGRLSSDRPNLQNIPVRSENGKLVRKGFMAEPGWLLLSADYSQAELRILAHLSEDPVMIQAFLRGEDIHAQTASEVSGIPLKEIKLEDRLMAKAVNFGLMYGQSSFGLAKTLGITRSEAKDYITRYFERFSQVKAYIDDLKEFAENNGYSETIYGRKRFLPDIHSQNRTIKSMAERLAVNSPIQGTASDIIKKAMINLDRKIENEKLESRMLLQVHDELIFEVPENELERMKNMVRTEMENVVQLKVPLNVDLGIGVNWYDLK